MQTLSLVFGLVILILGAVALPSPPATPKEIGASGAMPAFFFGGAYLICALFIKFHGRHGKVALGLIALCGVSFGLYGTVTQSNRIIMIHFPLLIASLLLGSITYRAWRKSRPS